MQSKSDAPRLKHTAPELRVILAKQAIERDSTSEYVVVCLKLISSCWSLGCRGDRIEVNGFQGYDVTRGAEFLGQSWMTNALIRINTTNAVNGWAGWPFRASEYFWESFAIKVRPGGGKSV